jgi:hypothetical protein
VRLLIDTHTIIWTMDDPTKLSGPATIALQDPVNDLLLRVCPTSPPLPCTQGRGVGGEGRESSGHPPPHPNPSPPEYRGRGASGTDSKCGDGVGTGNQDRYGEVGTLPSLSPVDGKSDCRSATDHFAGDSRICRSTSRPTNTSQRSVRSTHYRPIPGRGSSRCLYRPNLRQLWSDAPVVMLGRGLRLYLWGRSLCLDALRLKKLG